MNVSQPLDHRHARAHAAKDCVLAVQKRRGRQSDEELQEREHTCEAAGGMTVAGQIRASDTQEAARAKHVMC